MTDTVCDISCRVIALAAFVYLAILSYAYILNLGFTI